MGFYSGGTMPHPAVPCRYKDAFQVYIQEKVLPSLRDHHDEHLLKQLKQRWDNHKVPLACTAAAVPLLLWAVTLRGGWKVGQAGQHTHLPQRCGGGTKCQRGSVSASCNSSVMKHCCLHRHIEPYRL